MEREKADRTRRTGPMMDSEVISGAGRPLPGTSFEDLLFILRRRASAQPSPQTSDIERTERGRDEDEDDLPDETTDSDEMLNAMWRQLGRNSQRTETGQPLILTTQQQGRREAKEEPMANERREEEQQEEEEEPDPEHEDVGIERREPKEVFGLQKEIDQTALERMTNPTEILMRGKQETESIYGQRRRYETKRNSPKKKG
jgi:hypothetical protein